MRKQENFWIEYGEEKEGMVESIELRQMLQNLDIKYRIPLILYYYNGFSIKEISSILSEPVNTVKTHLARGKKWLSLKRNLWKNLRKMKIYL